MDNAESSSSTTTTAPASLLGQSYISSIIEDLQWAFGEWTNQTLDVTTAEDWAIFLHGILTRESRGYHGLQHVFVLCAGASPMQLLAAVFRDVISHYIDGGESLQGTRQMQLLEGVFEPNTLVLSKDLADPRDRLVIDIFGHKLGQDLAMHHGLHQGLDVFLSAMLANRLLKEHLALPYLAQLAACLETTVPFRKANEQGQTPLDLLFLRFVDCNQKYQLGLTEPQIIETLQQSADLHNRSVGNMVSDDLAEFLDHTWSLLPERHASLRRRALYTLAEYYQAIHSMVDVTEGLQPTNVYITFRGLPDEMEMNKFRMRLKRNLSISCVYLRARLFCVAVVSAFAYCSGGDGPKSFFFGDLPSVDRQVTERLGDGLMAEQNEEEDRDKHDEVYDILRGDRISDKGFDTRAAPLAAYLYRELGKDVIFEALEYAEVPMTKESGLKLLKFLPKDVVCSVGTEVARVTVSRSKRIAHVLQEHFRG